MNSFIIKKPWVTEKATSLNASGQYVFLVVKGATKPEIKKAIEELYKVKVTSVNVVNRPAKQKRFRGVMHNAGDRQRKAIVTLKEGQKIDIS